MKEILKLLSIAIIGGLVVVGIQQFTINDTVIQTDNVIKSEQIINLPTQAVNNTALTKNSYSSPELKDAANSTLHAVVYILTEFSRKSSVYDDYFSLNDFFGNRSNSVLKASGSGVIISSDGYIVTNNHVVQEADKITITLNDKRVYNAKVIGTDPTTDLALLKIEEESLEFLTYGDSDELEIGDWVLAVGNPFNLTSTVTAGIISAKARNINILGSNSAIESFLQTDAVVNPGNSGGALVDTDGKLVGINAAIASRTGSYIGYSFAIPVTIVKKVIKDLKEFGRVQRAFIGVTIEEVDAKLAKKLNLDKITGVYVKTVLDKGAAKQSGIEAGDIILKVEGVEINSTSELLERIGLHRPGNKIKLDIIHNQKVKEYDVVLTNANGETKLDDKSYMDNMQRTGAKFNEISSSLKESLHINYGVQVISVESGLFKSAGIRAGFIIQSIDKTKVSTTKEVEDALKNTSGGILIEGLYPNGVRAYYGIGI
ncbi:MAG: trypsin-like peptidase domain-containing protein [Bacteroidales bacterium]|nr:trypsin-like peptidase domain-containing protein [Bacteroidales bacterium]